MFNPQPIQLDTAGGINTFKNFLQYVRQKISAVILLMVLSLAAALGWRQFSSPRYKAACSFVLEEKSGGASGIAGLASQFGIDLGAMGGGSGNFFSGENIADIITSSTIMDKVLLSKADEQHTLADLYLDASGMRKAWGWKGRLENFSFAASRTDQASLQLRDTALLVIRERMKKKDLIVDRTSKKGSIYGVVVNSSNPAFAKLFTERLVQTTGDLYIDIKNRNITANIQKLELRADSLQKTFGSRSRQTFSQQILNANEAFKSNLATVEISQRDKSVVFELYAEVMKNLEVSRMLLMNQTPVIQILDKPQQPMVDTRPGLLKTLTFGLVAGLVLVTILLSLGYMRKT
jgi:hypothetical protein